MVCGTFVRTLLLCCCPEKAPRRAQGPKPPDRGQHGRKDGETNLRSVPEEEYFDRLNGPSNQRGFVAQHVEASRALDKSLKRFEEWKLMALVVTGMTRMTSSRPARNCHFTS
eukprot:s5938_g6.t1